MSVTSSSYVNNTKQHGPEIAIRNDMFKPLPIHEKSGPSFKTALDLFPWWMVDMGSTRTVSGVLAVLTHARDDRALIDVRVGYEKIGLRSGKSPLIQNLHCTEFERRIGDNNVTCDEQRKGRIITLQMMECGRLEVEEFRFYPPQGR